MIINLYGSSQIACNMVVAFFRHLDLNARGRIEFSYCNKREKKELTLNIIVWEVPK